MKTRHGLAAALSTAVLVAGCSAGADSGGGEAKTIKVGTLFSVTGPAANVGDKMRKGIELAIDQINQRGGIDGKKIEWKFYDPAGDTATAVSQTRKLLTSDKVDVVVGGGSASGIALAMAQLTEPAKKLFVATEGARNIVQPESAHALTFKATFNDTVVIQKIIEFWKAKGVSRVAMLPDTTGFGQSALEVAKQEVPAACIKMDVASFDTGTNDFTPTLGKLAAGKPQAYLAWTTDSSGVAFIKNARALVRDDSVLIQHGHGFVDDRYMRQAGEASVGTVLASPKLPVYDLLPDSDPQKKTIGDFVTAYQAKYQEQPNVYAGQAYDAMMITAEAIEKAGTTDGPALAKALENLGEYVGLTGVFRYSAQDHSGLASDGVTMIKWDGTRFVPAGS
ncbi:ABC transporter substrate-binding protein [Microbispora hainanensis]|uniref:ABC transporter substrate-binding protein n=1 Tax=Microbispora hainanensis TaxID=568844 RepID=UPI003409A261